MERSEAEAFVVRLGVWRVARASPMSGFPPENDIAPDSSTSMSECCPEESVSSDEKNAHRRRAAAQKKI